MSAGRCVVDASVVTKWYVPEAHRSEALRFLDGSWELAAPDLLFAELGNVLWKKTRHEELTAGEAREILAALRAVPLSVHPTRPLLSSALDIALETGRSVYDSLYLTLAIALDCRMVTADQKLVKALAAGPLADHIEWVAAETAPS